MSQSMTEATPSSAGDETGGSLRSHANGKTGWLAAGGLLGAFGAASCCLLPIALVGAGVGSAWVGNLEALAPFQPVFIVAALALLGAGFFVRFRASRACATDRSCARPAPSRLTGTVLWGGLILLIAALAFPVAAPFLAG